MSCLYNQFIRKLINQLKYMKKTNLLYLILAMGLLHPTADGRKWTSADGSKTFEATLKSYDEATGNVVVTKTNGRAMTFNKSILSAEDIEFVKAEGKAPVEKEVVKTKSAVKEVPDVLPDPDGKEADMSKPVQVFIMMGQSNMLGFGKAGTLKGIAAEKYPYLVDDGSAWNVRKDVRNTFFCMGKLRYNDWLTAENGNGSGKFGPEIGIGNYLGHVIDAPVLILKSCVGNRALGWDLLPPSAVGTGAGGKS
ncbi:MAG: hypothetical protein ACI9E1_000273, partial [Cryomorphaceae bacterium]